MIQKGHTGTCPLVQWSTPPPNAGGPGFTPGQGTGSHIQFLDSGNDLLQLKIPLATSKNHHSQIIFFFLIKREERNFKMGTHTHTLMHTLDQDSESWVLVLPLLLKYPVTLQKTLPPSEP